MLNDSYVLFLFRKHILTLYVVARVSASEEDNDRINSWNSNLFKYSKFSFFNCFTTLERFLCNIFSKSFVFNSSLVPPRIVHNWVILELLKPHPLGNCVFPPIFIYHMRHLTCISQIRTFNPHI